MLFRSVLALLVCSYSSAVVLTPENYDELTAGKSVFIKFYAPVSAFARDIIYLCLVITVILFRVKWCGHCKKLAPTWDKLMDEFKGDATKLVADVDCTGSSKPLCEAYGVKGFPTLKYGDPTNLEDYKGAREEEALRTHINTKLGPSCSPANIDLCDDEKKAEIKKFQELSDEALKAAIESKEEELKVAEAAFKKGVEGLQSAYEALQKTRDAALEEVKKSGLGLMKSVAKHLAKQAGDAKKDEL